MERNRRELIYGAPTTFKGIGIEKYSDPVRNKCFVNRKGQSLSNVSSGLNIASIQINHLIYTVFW